MIRKESNKAKYKRFLLMLIVYIMLMLGLSVNRTQAETASAPEIRSAAEQLKLISEQEMN
ncbi:MAG: hypothetical protein IJL78_08855 [Lachnospiraceae bacterium]|nr:hypothetical protein [Lachnospiraceae bacterium]